MAVGSQPEVTGQQWRLTLSLSLWRIRSHWLFNKCVNDLPGRRFFSFSSLSFAASRCSDTTKDIHQPHFAIVNGRRRRRPQSEIEPSPRSRPSSAVGDEMTQCASESEVMSRSGCCWDKDPSSLFLSFLPRKKTKQTNNKS